MAGRTLNRRKLRKEADQAEAQLPAVAEPKPVVQAVPPAKVKKAPPAKKPPRKRAPKDPPRLRARWGVFDSTMKQVAIFDYKQRAAAEEKVGVLTASKKGLYFLRIVKVPFEGDGDTPRV
jgi:hypothetical protein